MATPTPIQVDLIDALLRKLTAVESLAALRDLQAGGYVPTVDPRRSRRLALLARLLTAAGVRVWTGSNDPR